MSYKVIRQHWSENSCGEQSNGPPVLDCIVTSEEEAKTRIAQLTIVHRESPQGCAYGSWSWYESC